MGKKIKIKADFFGNTFGFAESSSGLIIYPPNSLYDEGVKHEHYTICNNPRFKELDVHSTTIYPNKEPKYMDLRPLFSNLVQSITENMSIVNPSSVQKLKRAPQNTRAMVYSPKLIDLMFKIMKESNLLSFQDNMLQVNISMDEADPKGLGNIIEQSEKTFEGVIQYMSLYDALKQGYPQIILIRNGEFLLLLLKNGLILSQALPNIKSLESKNLLQQFNLEKVFNKLKFKEPALRLQFSSPSLSDSKSFLFKKLEAEIKQKLLPNPLNRPVLDSQLESALIKISPNPERKLGLTLTPMKDFIKYLPLF